MDNGKHKESGLAINTGEKANSYRTRIDLKLKNYLQTNYCRWKSCKIVSTKTKTGIVVNIREEHPHVIKTIRPANEKKAIRWLMENTKKAD